MDKVKNVFTDAPYLTLDQANIGPYCINSKIFICIFFNKFAKQKKTKKNIEFAFFGQTDHD